MLQKKFIFCYWILFFSILYYFNIIPFSLLYSAFIAILFSIYHFRLCNMHISKKGAIIFMETLYLGLNIRKHFYIDNKNLISIKDIIFNIILFLVYLTYIHINDLNFNKIYFETIYKVHGDPDETLWEHIKKYYKFTMNN